MPLFMDFHLIANVTIEAVKEAHIADIAIQNQYGVKYHQFWVNEEAGTVFCLAEGPDKETVELVHRTAHGNIPCALTEVEPGFYRSMMGEKQNVEYSGLVKTDNGAIDLGYRHILVVLVMEDSKSNSSDSHDQSQTFVSAKHDVSHCISKFGGRELNWAIDESLIGVFSDADKAVQCAVEIQKTIIARNDRGKLILKIGLTAEQPVTSEGNFFTTAIRLAHRLSHTANDNQILISSLVRKLSKESIKASLDIKFVDVLEEQFIEKLHDITEQNLSNSDFTIDEICREIGISRAQLYRKLLLVAGRSPNTFIRDLRLEKAMVLLKQKTGNISQVALEVGYSNPSYFTKCFAEKFGYNPSSISISYS